MAIAAGLLLLCPVIGVAEQKVLEPLTVPARGPAALSAIPVSDVATRATEMENLLQTIHQQSEPIPDIEKIQEMLPEIRAEINRNFAETMIIIDQQPMFSVLQTQQQLWQKIRLKNTGWLSVLTKRSKNLQALLTRLSELQKVWSMTIETAKTSKTPQPVLQQIKETLTALNTAQKPLSEELKSALDNESYIAEEVEKCDKALAQIAQARKKAVGGILVRDSIPITSAAFWTNLLTELPERINIITATYRDDIIRYFNDPYERMPLHAAIFVFLMLLFLSARHQIRKWSRVGESMSSALRVFNHPVAMAIALTLLITTSSLLSVPYAVKALFRIISIVPVIILVRPVVETRIIPGLYRLGLLIAIQTVLEVFSGDPLMLRVILMLESVAGIAALIWFLRNLEHLHGEAAGLSRLRILQAISGLFILIFSIGFAAAVTGNTRLALILTPGIVFGCALALALFAFVLIMSGIVDFAFHIWPLRTFRMVQYRRVIIEKMIYRLLICLAIINWFGRYLNNIGFLEPTLSFGKSILNAKLERGSISISPGDVLAFFFTVWVAYLLSAFIRFTLNEDVYPRLKITVGKSYAVSSLLHYVIITLGFVAAIGMLGVDLTKVTVLASALGVGIGFGLQSVVNNFVSGLILLVERPVNIGDTVEVGELLGQVRKIGIRASTVHTRQGADIIVPNSQLISDKVTNWTLSDQMRRIDLPVGVSYGAVPGDVIKVLEKVANENRHVLPDPPPQGLFTGFGDSSINFELRAWTDQFDDWPQIRSELAVAVFDAVRAAGMTFPFPQREVRLLRETDKGQNSEKK
jgi:potassium-dependent mechanosensitive channel